MKYRKLGKTNVDVSLICLGTMTWGEQNTELEGFSQMDYALENGINFFDTAELYSVPPRKETFGSTEIIIGNWLRNKKCREKIILATKVVGRSGMKWFRGKETRLNEEQITKAIEGSLKRLQTDYIDLYQLHWPDRKANFFGKLGYEHHEENDIIDIKEQLEVLDKLVKQGKIRFIGLSNETPWGLMKFLSLSDKYDLPRVVSVQNPYSLLNRSYEVGMAEISIRESCGLLAYSPLGFGVLSGKYRNGEMPENSRLKLFPNLSRFSNNNCARAIDMYFEISQKHNMTLTEMSLAFVNDRPFVTSNIIGATSMNQLKENINSINIKLSDEIISEINLVNEKIPNPAP